MVLNTGIALEVRRRVPVARQHRVTATDHVDVAGHDPADGCGSDDPRRERERLAQHLERDGGDDELLGAGREHGDVGVGRSGVVAVDGQRHARTLVDGAEQRLRGGPELLEVEVAREGGRRTAQRAEWSVERRERRGRRHDRGRSRRRRRRPPPTCRRPSSTPTTARTRGSPPARRSRRRGRSPERDVDSRASPLPVARRSGADDRGRRPPVHRSGSTADPTPARPPARDWPDRRPPAHSRRGSACRCARSAPPPPPRIGRPDVRGRRRSGRARVRDRTRPRASSAPGSTGCRLRGR